MINKPVWTRTITTLINMAGKVAKDRTCVRSVGGEVIGPLKWLTLFVSTIVHTFLKEIGILDVGVVLNLLI